MKCQPNRNYKSDDVVMTPDALAKLMDTPKEFPQTGFQLWAVYIQRGYSGSVGLSKLDY